MQRRISILLAVISLTTAHPQGLVFPGPIAKTESNAKSYSDAYGNSQATAEAGTISNDRPSSSYLGNGGRFPDTYDYREPGYGYNQRNPTDSLYNPLLGQSSNVSPGFGVNGISPSSGASSATATSGLTYVNGLPVATSSASASSASSLAGGSSPVVNPGYLNNNYPYPGQRNPNYDLGAGVNGHRYPVYYPSNGRPGYGFVRPGNVGGFVNPNYQQRPIGWDFFRSGDSDEDSTEVPTTLAPESKSDDSDGSIVFH